MNVIWFVASNLQNRVKMTTSAYRGKHVADFHDSSLVPLGNGESLRLHNVCSRFDLHPLEDRHVAVLLAHGRNVELDTKKANQVFGDVLVCLMNTL